MADRLSSIRIAAPTRPAHRGKRKIPVGGLLLAPVLLWLVLFMVVPLFIMFMHTFWTAHLDTMTIDRTFTLDHYVRIVSNPLYRSVFVDTLVNTSLVVVFCLLLGYPMAYWLVTQSATVKFVVLMALAVPLWTSILFRSYAWTLVLNENGLVMAVLRLIGFSGQAPEWLLYSRFAIIVSLVQIYLPFMYFPLFAVLDRLDWQLVEAAKNLGASRARAFWEITLPLSLPGLVTGFLFVFVPAMGAYVTPALLGGPSGQVVATLIASQFGNAWNWPLGGALSIALMALVAGVIVLALRVARPWELYRPKGAR